MRNPRFRIFFIAAAVGAFTGGVPAASAQTCIAPPGRAAIEQYCESVPGPGGDRGATADKGKQPRLSARAARTRVALERADEEGRELADFLAKAPAPASQQDPSEPRTTGGKSSKGAAKGERGAEAVTVSKGVPSDGVASAVRASSSAGAGALAAVGIAGVVGLLTLLVVRRRAPR